ncbi:MAG: hypothetical protein AB2536_06605 [Candidatus Thiodiazotropha endolucinida]
MENAIALLVFAIIVLYLVFRDTDEKSAYTFLISDRSVSPFRIAASLSSGFRDGAGLAAWVAFGYYFDIGAIWLFFGMALALFYLSIIGARVRKLVENTVIYSLNQFVREYVGVKSGYFTVVVLAITAILITGAQLHVSGVILSTLIKAPVIFGIILIAVFVGIYVIIGGFRAVLLTDVFQWTVLFVVFLVPLFVVSSGSNIQPNWDTISSPGQLLYSLVPLVFLIVATGGDVWQRIFSASDAKAARSGLLITIPLYLALSIGVVLLALAIKALLPNAEGGQAFFMMFQEGVFSGWGLAVLGVFTVAAITSTIDTQAFVFASALASSIRKKKRDEQLLEKADVSVTRWLLIAFLFVVSLVAYSIGDIVVFLFSSYSFTTILFPLLLLIAIRGKSLQEDPQLDIWIVSVLIFSSVVYFVLWVLGYYSELAFTLVAPAVAIIGTAAVALIRGHHAPNY